LRHVAAAGLVLACATLAGCVLSPPSGDAPLRYRDEVFGQVDVRSNLRYGTAAELQLDLYEPRGDTAARRPAVIWVHGGGFSRGSRRNEKIVDLATTYARLGYVGVAISYRLLAPDTCAEDPREPECAVAARAAKHDAHAAVRWLRASAQSLRIDPTRIAIGGFSAGAIVALAVGTSPEDAGAGGNPGFASDVRAVVSNCGGFPSGDPVYETITPGDAPTVFFHGSADRTVPLAWARATHDALQADGVVTGLHVFQGQGHCPRWADTRQFTVDQSKYFLYYLMDLRTASA
jgi:acetyl esterase/lipase